MRRFAAAVALTLICVVMTGCGNKHIVRPTFTGGPLALDEAKVRELTDKDIQAILDKRPLAKFPVTLAVACVDRSYSHGYYGYWWWNADERARIKEEEKQGWLEATKGIKAISDTCFVSDLLLPEITKHDGHWQYAGHSMKGLRAAAARLHADLLLVYSAPSDYGNETNPASLLYLTIVGCWVSPGNDISSYTLARAALVDVRTGYVYAVAEDDAEAKTITPVAYDEKVYKKLMKKTRAEAVTKLQTQIKSILPKLKGR